MLDKDQIKDWDGIGEPPAKPDAAAKAAPVEPTAAPSPTPDKARKRRGQWLALGLFAFVILIFTLTMTKMGANIMVRDL